MVSVGSAPAKVILFGEHAVVYGKPAIAMAVDMRFEVTIKPSPRNITLVEGHPIKERYHAYVKYVHDHFYSGPPLDYSSKSGIPSASGLGSSAALTIATLGALKAHHGELEPSIEEIARMGHETEYEVQGIASPTDTTTSAHGGGIYVANEQSSDHLWSISRGGKTWHLHKIDIPEDMHIVVGYSGESSKTRLQVKKVSKATKRSKFGMEMIDEIGDVVEEARGALKKKDVVRLGELMNKNQKLLTILGASNDKLQALIDAVSDHSYGVKLTGAGGGGSVIAITDKPELVRNLFEKRGAKAYMAKPASVGVKVNKGV